MTETRLVLFLRRKTVIFASVTQFSSVVRDSLRTSHVILFLAPLLPVLMTSPQRVLQRIKAPPCGNFRFQHIPGETSSRRVALFCPGVGVLDQPERLRTLVLPQGPGTLCPPL